MADRAERVECPRCRELEQRIAVLETQLAKVTAELAAVTAKLAAATKSSSTSSKPPSSDLVKPPKPGRGQQLPRRLRGAQPGHTKQERAPFGSDEVDETFEYQAESCPDCGGELELLPEPGETVQQVEIVEQPIRITEHRSRICRCPKCQTEVVTPLPAAVTAAGLAGPRLTALVGHLKGACHCSYTTIQTFLDDVLGLHLSRGYLSKLCGKVATSVDPAYQDLLARLPAENRLNVDETGHKENGKGMWTWCFRARLFTLFKIDPSRGSEVLVETLGREFAGVLGCDYFSAYRKYMRLNEQVQVQFCLAHLIRDVRFLVEHPEPKNRAYGRRVLTALRDLFAIVHRREKYRSERAFRGELEDQGYEVWTQATHRVPRTNEAQNLAERFHQHGEDYIRFVTTPGVEPTNNLAEQAIRFVVLDRKVTQGTRSPAGRTWCERIWTVLATCAQQGESAFNFLTDSVQALFSNTPPPTLARAA
jgi:transposase